MDSTKLIDIVFPYSQQIRSELEWFCAKLDQWQPRRVLEIGRWSGGTTAILAAYSNQVVSVDIKNRSEQAFDDPRYIELVGKTSIIVLEEDSQLSETVNIVKRVNNNRPYDLVFIDGAHEDDFVRHDWEVYGALAPIVAFHDIRGYEDDSLIPPNFGPPKLWRELKKQYRTEEAVHSIAGGIGVVYK